MLFKPTIPTILTHSVSNVT